MATRRACALRREPQCLDARAAALAPVAGVDRRLDARSRRCSLRQGLGEGELRRYCRELVVTMQAALLARYGPQGVSDAFVSTRLGGQLVSLASLPQGLDLPGLADRATWDEGRAGARG